MNELAKRGTGELVRKRHLINPGHQIIIRDQDCPDCGFEMKVTTCAYGDHLPEPGDPSVCFGCNSIHVFDEELRLRRPTPEECEKLEAQVDVQRIRIARENPSLPPLREIKRERASQEARGLALIEGRLP